MITASTSDVTLSTNALLFTPTSALSQSFTVTAVDTNGATLYYSLSGPDAPLYQLSGSGPYQTVSARLLNVAVTQVNTHSILSCGGTATYSLSIEKNPTSTLTISITDDGTVPGVTINPSTISIGPSDPISTTFTVSGTSAGITQLYFAVSGNSANLYNPFPAVAVSFAPRSINLPNLAVTASAIAQESLSLSTPTATSLSVSLSATGVTFTPSTLNFVAGQASAAYTVNVTNPGTYTVNVNVAAGGDAPCFDQAQYTFTLTASPLTLYASYSPSGTVPFGQQSTPVTVSIPGLANNVNVQPYTVPSSAGVTFTPSVVSLSAANPTGIFYISSKDFAQTSFTIHYITTSTDPGFDPTVIGLPTTSVSFGPISYLNTLFSGIDSTPNAYVGVTSAMQSLVLQYPPVGAAQVTLSAPGITFNPSVLNFNPTTTVQTFTFTPTVGDPTQSYLARQVTFTASGSPDVAAPSPAVIYVYMRPLDIISTSLLGPLYVGQTFSFTVVASIPPTNGLTLTAGPSNANPALAPFTFTNAVQQLNSQNTAVTFTGTVNSLLGTSVVVSVSGPDASLYARLPNAGVQVNVQASTITVNYNNLKNSNGYLLYGEMGYGTITLDSAPVSGLTVVVVNDQLTVNPSTFTFTPSSPLYATFTVTPNLNQAVLQGSVTSSFTIGVSGADAPNYAVVGGTNPTFYFATESSTLLRAVSVTVPPAYQGGLEVSMGGVVNSPITLAINDAPINSVIFTPVVQGHPEITFSPPSVTFSGTSTTASFIMQGATKFTQQTLTGYFEVSGPDAYLYATHANFAALKFQFSFQRTTLSGISNILVTSGLPSTLTVGQLSSLPVGNINIYPVVMSGPPLTFTPSSFSYTPTAQSTQLSVLGTSVGLSLVAFVINGTDANWMSPVSQIQVSVQQRSLSVTAAGSHLPGDTQTLTITIAAPPAVSLTVQPVCSICSFSGAATFTPSSALTMVIPFTISTAAVQNAIINYVVTGSDASVYATLATTTYGITPRQIAIQLPGTAPIAGATTGTGTVTLTDGPAINGVTVGIIAPGYTISTSPLVFPAGTSQQTFTYTVLSGAAANAPVQLTLSGQDAGWYTVPTAQYFQNTVPTISASTSGVPSSSALTTYFRLSVGGNLVDTVTVTPVAQPGITFSPNPIVLSPGQTDVIVSATLSSSNYASLATQSIVVSFTQTGAVNTKPVIAPVTIQFAGLQVDTPNAIGNLVIGSTSFPQTITVSPRNLVGTDFASIQLNQQITVTLYSNNGATITPSSITLSPPSYMATYTVSPTELGAGTIYYSVSGSNLFPTNYGTLTTYNGIARSFDFPSNLFTADYENIYQGQETDVFLYGQTTRMYTIYTTVVSNVVLTPTSDHFTFNPPQLTFSSTTTSANFTMTATKVGHTIITWGVSGSDAQYFTRPATYNLIVGYNIQFGAIAPVQVGQTSKNIVMSISPTPVEPVFVTFPTTPTAVTFNPARVVFTPTSLHTTFTITGKTPTVGSGATVLANNQGNTGLYSSTQGLTSNYLALGTGTGGASIQVRHASESTPFANPLLHPVPVTVTPGLIQVKHPRYQLDVTSHVEFEVNPAPISDLTVGLWGNNLFFDPPFAVFSPNVTKVKVKATPTHTISYEIDYKPFVVEYQCTGSNAAHYVCPTESLHFFAMPRGYVAALVLVPLFAIVLIVVGLMFCRGGKRMVN